MHSIEPIDPMSPDLAPQGDTSTQSSSANGNHSGEDSSARPFIERRRPRSVDEAWHAVLDPVHKLLVRYDEAYRAMVREEQKYRSILEDVPIGVFRASEDGKLLFVNRSMAEICGFESPDLLLSGAADGEYQPFAYQLQWNEIVQLVRSNGMQCGIEIEVICREGRTRWVQLNVRPTWENGQILHYEGTAEDITDRKSAVDRIRMLAYYDQVTGLPNRPQFEERLNDALAAARWKNENVALLLLEVGRFKSINDSLGKSFGDRLLQEVAERIKRVAGQHCTVARIGGAEFAVIVPLARDPQEIESTARRMIAEVCSEFSYLGHSLNVTSSIGISMFPRDARDGDTLLEQADVAMDTARESAPNELRFFTEQMNIQIRQRLEVEKDLRLAMDRDEFFLVYQPQVDVRTGAVSGLEALLRWQHPQRGLIPPNDFISVAESSGLIVALGEWVLRKACRQAMSWQEDGLPPVPIAVNVSAIQFRHQGFCNLVRSVLHETGLDPKYLELELTEGLLLTNADVVFELIHELRLMGVKLTIDDFGTGYSSLGYLRQFKVNRLKIDRSFVRDVPLNADDSAITTAIINMAKALNLDVLAEGVENADQLAFLRERSCFEIQGYYFSKPIGVDLVAERLQASFA